MQVKVNGNERKFEGGEIALPELLRQMNVDPEMTGIAVALNEELVPRGEWEKTKVKDGDVLEVITARQGG